MTYASHTGLLPLLLLWPHLQFFYLLISCLSSLALLLCFSFFSYILPRLPSLLPLSYPLSSSLLLLSLPTSSILPHLLLNYSIDILFSFPLVSVPFFFVFPLPPLSLLSSWLPYIFLWSLYSLHWPQPFALCNISNASFELSYYTNLIFFKTPCLQRLLDSSAPLLPISWRTTTSLNSLYPHTYKIPSKILSEHLQRPSRTPR